MTACRVLLVFDDPDARFLIGRRLRAIGCVVVDAEGLAEAFESLGACSEEGPPCDVIITGETLHGGPGLELLAELGELDWQIPVIVIIPRNAGLGILQRAWRLGAYAVFHEPFDLDALETAVRCARPGTVGHA